MRKAVRTALRTHAFIPEQSPPLVSIPIFLIHPPDNSSTLCCESLPTTGRIATACRL